MKKFGLLVITIAVLFSVFAGCANNQQTDWSDGGNEERRDGGNDGDGGGRERTNRTPEEGGIISGILRNREEGTPGIFSAASSALAVNNALGNFDREIMQRFETTPLYAIVLLAEAFEHGTTNVNFTYVDEWGQNNSNVVVNASFLSDAANLDFALRGDVSFEGINVDFSTFLNTERLAVGSSWLGSDYLGINFATLAQDLPRLLGEFDLGDISEIYDILEIFDVWSDFMEIALSGQGAELDAEFFGLFLDFMSRAEQSPANVDGMTRIAYRFSMEDVNNFLRESLNWLERNSDVIFTSWDMFDIPFISNELRTSRAQMEREFFAEMREAVSYLNAITGDMTVAFYIGSGDRLARINAYGELAYRGDAAAFSAALDLGNSATDNWSLTFRGYYDNELDFEFILDWDIRETGGRTIHEFGATMNEPGWGSDTYSFIADWNRTSGDLVFAVQTPWGRDELPFGRLTISGRTFNFRFEYIESGSGWRHGAIVEISTQSGANIGNVNFTNVMTLTAADFERIGMEIVTRVMGGMMMGW